VSAPPGVGDLLDVLEGAWWEADAVSLRVRSISPRVVGMFGHSEERWTCSAGRAELVVEEDRAPFLMALLGAREGRPQDYEYRIRTAAGNVVPVLDRFVRLGRDSLVGLLLPRVTAPDRAERLVQAEVAATAHRLNNVLTTIACHVEAAGRGDLLAGQRVEAAIADASQLTGRLVGRARRSDRASAPDGLSQAVPPSGAGALLIVEDEPDLRGLMGRVLTRAGFAVVLASDPEVALEHLERNVHVELLLTDLVLGHGACGRELLLRARQARPGLRAIVMSGERGEGIDGAGFLAKPFTPRDLMTAVRGALAPSSRTS
jgi:CheY-like chemotaxis protein